MSAANEDFNDLGSIPISKNDTKMTTDERPLTPLKNPSPILVNGPPGEIPKTAGIKGLNLNTDLLQPISNVSPRPNTAGLNIFA